MIQLLDQYVSPKSLLLFVLEAILTAISILCAVWLRFWQNPGDFDRYVNAPMFPWQLLAVMLVFQICFYYGNLYSPLTVQDRNEQYIRLGQSLGVGCVFLGVVYYIFPPLLIGRGVLLIGTGLIVAFVLGVRMLLDTAWKAADIRQNSLVLGTGDLAALVADELNKRQDLSARVVGCLGASREQTGREIIPGMRVLGTIDDLESVVERHSVSRIIVAVSDRRGTLPIRQLMRLRVAGLRVEDVHTTMAALTGRIWLKIVQPSWFVFTEGFRRSNITLILKRALDILLAVLALTIALPVMVLVAIAIWIDSGRPILFRQARVGWRDRPFQLLKFRSMGTDAERGGVAQWASSDDPRVTRVGRYLRKYRLDELPQFINIIRGEMSFVGPRPERPVFVNELQKAIPYYDERHLVRPGLTGWAQVNSGYGASVEDSMRKLEYDLFYLKNMSFWFDCMILIHTLRIVFTGHGAR
jgi:sugar transferase (PEP-CTERM system associated)